MKHKQNLKKYILLIGSLFLMCSKKGNEDSNNYPHSKTDVPIVMDAPTIKKIFVDTSHVDTIKADTTHKVDTIPDVKQVIKNERISKDTDLTLPGTISKIEKRKTFEKTYKVESIKNVPLSRESSRNVTSTYKEKSIQKQEPAANHEKFTSPKIKKIKDTVVQNPDIKVNKDTFPCSISFPVFYASHERPETITEANELSQFFWQKALCYKSINIDSCFSYTQKAIKTYENGSLFTLKAYCLYKFNMFSASKTATEISLSRNDHWNLNDTKIALSIKIQVLDIINKTQPSFEIKSELEKSKNEYKNLYGNN